EKAQPLPAHTEEELRKELAQAPEVSLTAADVEALVRTVLADFDKGQMQNQTDLDPGLLLQVRPDLGVLPIRSGRYCRLSAARAATLQTLSQKLHAYVTLATPKDGSDRVNALLLEQALRAEMRGGHPEWLRPEAVPVLQQLLMAENAPLRLMLVDL